MVSLSEIERAIEEIPPAFHIGHIISLIRDPTVPITKISEEISKNAELTAEVLKIVNSPIYGFSRRIENLEHAIAIIGTKNLEYLILSLLSRKSLKKELKAFNMRQNELEIQSFLGGYISKKVAQDFYPYLEDISFTAGVLRNLSKIPMEYLIMKHKPDVFSKIAEGKKLFEDVEKEIFGITSTEVLQKILEKWNIPESIRIPLKFYQSPSEMKERGKNFFVAVLVHIGDRITMMLGIGGIDNLLYKIDVKSIEEAKIPFEKIPQYLEKAQEMRTEIEKILL